MPGEAFLEVTELVCEHVARGRFGWQATRFRAVDGVTFSLARGEVLGMAGESGAGKSTLVRCLAGWMAPSAGMVRLAGSDVYAPRGGRRMPLRRRLQLVLQDSGTAFHPAMTVAQIVREPLEIQRIGSSAERGERVARALEDVQLPQSCVGRLAAELSGGERRRLALARALVLEPEVLVLDETLANLDIPVQSGIIRLILTIREVRNLACLIVSHDLRILRRLADRVVILEKGRVAEIGLTQEVLTKPSAASTRELVRAMLDFPC